ncbi:MAG: alternative ribosome rescue aminoacyl-tRNA hydrolase ArfB [Bacteroidales bacterium]
MHHTDIRSMGLEKELTFNTSRSGGKGGQNVNKVNTKVELRFHVSRSELLSEYQKSIILEKLNNKISGEGVLILTSQVARTQAENKKKAVEKFYSLLERALRPEIPRVPTTRTRGSVEDRLRKKKIQSRIKQSRGRQADSDD